MASIRGQQRVEHQVGTRAVVGPCAFQQGDGLGHGAALQGFVLVGVAQDLLHQGMVGGVHSGVWQGRNGLNGG